MAENGSEGAHCVISSKFEVQHLPNPVAARDGSYLAAPEQLISRSRLTGMSSSLSFT
jgi:hypothetical protein